MIATTVVLIRSYLSSLPLWYRTGQHTTLIYTTIRSSCRQAFDQLRHPAQDPGHDVVAECRFALAVRSFEKARLPLDRAVSIPRVSECPLIYEFVLF